MYIHIYMKIVKWYLCTDENSKAFSFVSFVTTLGQLLYVVDFRSFSLLEHLLLLNINSVFQRRLIAVTETTHRNKKETGGAFKAFTR